MPAIKIKKVSRIIIESAIESSRFLGDLDKLVSQSTAPEIKAFVEEKKYENWLEGLYSFTKLFKSHLRQGREMLMEELKLDGLENPKILLKTRGEVSDELGFLETYLTGEKPFKNDSKKINLVVEEMPECDENFDFSEINVEGNQEPVNVPNSKIIKSISPYFIKYEDEILRTIETKKKGEILFGTATGMVLSYDSNTKEMLPNKPFLSNKPSFVRSLNFDAQGNLWVATSIRLFVFDRNYNHVLDFWGKERAKYFTSFDILFFSGDKKTCFWLTSNKDMLVINTTRMTTIASVSNLSDDIDEKIGRVNLLEDCTKILYVTNANLWKTYYIYDIVKRERISKGVFEFTDTWKFGIFGSCVWKNYVIATGSAYSSNTQDYGHVRVAKITKDYQVVTKAIKISNFDTIVYHPRVFSKKNGRLKFTIGWKVNVSVCEYKDGQINFLTIVRNLYSGGTIQGVYFARNTMQLVVNFGQVVQITFDEKAVENDDDFESGLREGGNHYIKLR